MTRKHFEALAAALSSSKEGEFAHTFPVSAEEMRQDIIGRIANVCAESNPRFDRDKFLAATLEG